MHTARFSSNPAPDGFLFLFLHRYFDRLRALPALQVAAGSIMLPMTGSVVNISFDNPEQPVASKSLPIDELTPVSTGFFNTMQIPLFEGRDFTSRRRYGGPAGHTRRLGLR
jgi:hypothetical protein